ncbi:hypothetical protein P5V15_011994 [Pogonomyrmex californicus]
MTETFEENRPHREMDHVIYHCRTTCETKIITYTWTISNFWDVCKFSNSLTSSNIETLPLKILMKMNKYNELKFFIINDCKIAIGIYEYKIFIYQQNDDGMVFHSMGIIEKHEQFKSRIPLCTMYTSYLQENENLILYNNMLTIQFIFKSPKISHNFICYNTLEMLMQEDINEFSLNNESDSFVTFIIGDNRICANKSLLYTSSEVFKTMLSSDDIEKNNEIEINDVSYDIFQILLSFLENKNHATKTYFLETIRFINNNPTKILCDILKAAHTYDIKHLKLLCEKFIIELTTKDNAVEHLYVAFQCNAVFLKEFLKKYIKLYLDYFIQIPKFLNITEMNPNLLSEISEQEIIVEECSEECSEMWKSVVNMSI